MDIIDANGGGSGFTQSTSNNDGYQGGYNQGGGYAPREEAKEIFSHRIHGKKRTFFVDLKESHNGKFIKISEKSNGQKRTILMDIEDFPEFFEAIKKVDELSR